MEQNKREQFIIHRMSANRVSSELAQNERLYNVEATNNVHVGGKRVRGFMGIEVVNPLPY